LSVRRAKIGTRLDQVVDVFYVTDSITGAKVLDQTRLEVIRERLLAELEPKEAVVEAQ
jgi:UTP:GlnB (protein PII) uridylyltransferase